MTQINVLKDSNKVSLHTHAKAHFETQTEETLRHEE